DRDLVGIVMLDQIAGDAEHEALLARVVVGELQHDFVLGKRLVLQRHLLGAGGRRGGCDQKRRDRRAKDGRKARHPCPAMPGLSSTPFSVTPGSARLGGLPDFKCLATTSQIGAPLCSLTEAQPATL